MPKYPAQKDNETRETVFSPCRKYRYYLAQIWDENKPPLYWLMLNPSTADEQINDPTVEGCEQRARKWGYGGSVVLNIFAWRATDPENLKKCANPIGDDNDLWMHKLAVLSQTHDVIAAWGEHGAHENRGQAVLDIFRQKEGRLQALIMNQSGAPRHPLYIKRSVRPTPFFPIPKI